MSSLRDISSKDEYKTAAGDLGGDGDAVSDFSGGDPGDYEDIKNKKIMGAMVLNNHKSLKSPIKQ